MNGLDTINDLCAVGLNNIDIFDLDLKASQGIFLAWLPKLLCVFKEKEVLQYFAALSVFGSIIRLGHPVFPFIPLIPTPHLKYKVAQSWHLRSSK